MSICGILDIRSYNIITTILIIRTNNLIKHHLLKIFSYHKFAILTTFMDQAKANNILITNNQ